MKLAICGGFDNKESFDTRLVLIFRGFQQKNGPFEGYYRHIDLFRACKQMGS